MKETSISSTRPKKVVQPLVPRKRPPLRLIEYTTEKKREPQYAHADASCLWELVSLSHTIPGGMTDRQMPFLNHFHPSVSLQANQLLLSQPLTGSADISLNTLVSFLDRFVYRNPKKTLQPKGASIMQPAAAGDSSGMIVNNKGARSAEGTYVNSEAFWRKKIADVPVDQVSLSVPFME
jgi:ribosome biogenesis protein MAK21